MIQAPTLEAVVDAFEELRRDRRLVVVLTENKTGTAKWLMRKTQAMADAVAAGDVLGGPEARSNGTFMADAAAQRLALMDCCHMADTVGQ